MYKPLFIKESIRRYGSVGIAEFRLKDPNIEGFIVRIGDYDGQYCAKREQILNGYKQVWNDTALRIVSIKNLTRLTDQEAANLLERGDQKCLKKLT